jgi:hypothetical protein
MSYVARHVMAKAEQIETAKKRNVWRASVGIASLVGVLGLTCLGVGYAMHKKADQLTAESIESNAALITGLACGGLTFVGLLVIGADNKRRRREEGSGVDAAVLRVEKEQTLILHDMMNGAFTEDENREIDQLWPDMERRGDELVQTATVAQLEARVANPINWHHVPVLQELGHDPYQAFMYHPHADRPVLERLPGAAMAAA